MCLAVCPYGAISLEHIGMPGVGGDSETMAQRSRREVAVRCDMCQAWRDKNGKKITACMEACPARALSMVEPDGTVILPPAPEAKPDAAAGAKPADVPDEGAATGSDAPTSTAAGKKAPSVTSPAETPDAAPQALEEKTASGVAKKPSAPKIERNIPVKPKKKTTPAGKK
jgi:Fe-S-cluster-containing dehydrogenase component